MDTLMARMTRLYFGTLDDPGYLAPSSLSEPSNVMLFTTLDEAETFLWYYTTQGRATYNALDGSHYNLGVLGYDKPIVRLYGPFTSRLDPKPETVFRFHGLHLDAYPDYELYVTRTGRIGRRKL